MTLTLDEHGRLAFCEEGTTLEKLLALIDMKIAIEEQANDLMESLSKKLVENSTSRTRSAPV